MTRARQQRDYLLGVGEAEISRLDMQHFMFRWELGDDVLAPITNPSAILDVACGTGRWARDMARRFPQAQVVGFDINDEQIERPLAEGAARGDPLPKNCTLVAGDALQRFAFDDSTFDLVMARATSAFMPASRYPDLLAEMTRVARPGGWIELRDFGLVQSGSSRAHSRLRTALETEKGMLNDVPSRLTSRLLRCHRAAQFQPGLALVAGAPGVHPHAVLGLS